jgi:hypothetical protein
MNQDIDQTEIRRRQRSRAVIMAWLLGGFVILVFAIAIVRIKAGA